MNNGPKLTPAPNTPVQANASAQRSGSSVRTFIPPALVTPFSGVRKAQTQKRKAIGGGAGA